MAPLEWPALSERGFMPIYEYQCKACGHQFEAIQSFSEDPLTKCPVCHKAKLGKLVSAPAFQLKGTGWYVTDFKDSGKQKDAVTKSAAKKENKKDDAKKTETKEKSDTKKGEDKS